jgi:hypothetical protein
LAAFEATLRKELNRLNAFLGAAAAASAAGDNAKAFCGGRPAGLGRKRGSRRR